MGNFFSRNQFKFFCLSVCLSCRGLGVERRVGSGWGFLHRVCLALGVCPREDHFFFRRQLRALGVTLWVFGGVKIGGKIGFWTLSFDWVVVLTCGLLGNLLVGSAAHLLGRKFCRGGSRSTCGDRLKGTGGCQNVGQICFWAVTFDGQVVASCRLL